MSAKSPPNSFTIDLRASPTLALVFVLLHGGAVGLALFLPLPVLVRVALVVALTASLYHTLRQHALREWRRAVTAIAFSDASDECEIRFRGSPVWCPGRLVDRWVHPRLAILVVRLTQSRWPVSVMIPADALGPESFRRLRVRLKLQASAE